jgi:DNA-binding LacI/PurR family transcriptional regulator
MEPGLTTIRLPAKQIGIAAADTIVQMSETGMQPSPLHQRMDVLLVERGSVQKLV